MDTEGGTDQKPEKTQANEEDAQAAHGSDTINDNEENEEEEEENISFHLENSSLDLSSSLSRSPPSSITTENIRAAAKKEDATSSSCSLSLPSTVSPFASPLVHIPTIHSPLAVSPNPSPPHAQQNEASNAALFLSSTQPDDPSLMEADLFFSELEDSEAEELDLSNPQSNKKPKMDWLGKGDPRKDPYFAPLFMHSKNKSLTTKSAPSKDNAPVGILEKEITSSSSLSTTPPTTPPDSPPREIYTQLKEEIGHSPLVIESSSSYDTDKEKQQQLKGRKRKREEEKQDKIVKPSSNVLLVPNTPRVKSWSKKFVCQQPSTDPPARVNHNKAITDIFEVMLQKSESTGDKWRAFAYRKGKTANLHRFLSNRFMKPLPHSKRIQSK